MASGGLLKLLDAYIAIGGDTAGFDAALSQSEAKAKSAGNRIESAFSPKRVFGALAGAAGALTGAAFSVALTGANELDAATRKLQADTGMTADAANAAEKAIAGMYQHNLQGFDQIGAAMAVVVNGLDLTGTAADAMTQKFLTFATATGQEAAPAVSSFHELLNAWNLTAADAPAIMDQLVASHQKYGSAVTDNEAALRTLAPQMIALGMNINDTIGLLNLFDVAGMDASKATFALNTAVQKLKPGQTLNDLIRQISSIEDPTLRAQAAVAIFGARGGVNLANALRPGITGLADFTINANDAAGATDKAAAAVQSGFGAQATLLLHNFGGALADIGTNFGPMLLAVSLLGPKLAGILMASIGGIGGLLVPKIIAPLLAEAGVNGAWMTTGTMIGTTIGAAATAALYLAVPLAIAGFLVLARDEWDKQTSALGLKVPDLFTGQGALAPNPGIIPAKPGTNYRQAWVDAGLEAGSAVTSGVGSGIDAFGGKAMNAVIAFAMKIGHTFADAMANAPVPVDKLLATFATGLQGVWDAAHRQGHETGVESMLAMAKGIEDARAVPLDAFTTMVTMMKTALTPQAEAARLAGELTSTQLVAGLRSKDPAVAAQAIATKEAILDRLAVIAKESGPLGKKAMDELAAGMKSKDPTIRAYATEIHDVVIGILDGTAADAKTAGANAASAFAAGLSMLNGNLPGWLATWLGVPGSAPKGYTPPTVTRPSGAIGGAASGMPYVARDMPVYVHQSEAILTVPQAQAWRAGAGGKGVAVNIENVTIADAHDEFSLVQQLRFLAAVQG